MTEVNQDARMLLREIMCCFFQQIPLRCFKPELLKYMVDNQKDVFDNTIQHEMNKNFPVRKVYQNNFAKKLIATIENNGSEVIEDLYVYITSNLTETENDKDDHYMHFPLSNHKFLVIKENSNLISDGTTGLNVWQAGKVLAEYCNENKSIFEKKSILELGCGLGLTGLSIIFNCNPVRYYFTDAHEKVLQYLVNNIELNLSIESGVKSEFKNYNEKNGLIFCRNYNDMNISVINLPWGKNSCDVYDSIYPDVILAADVVYDSTLFYPLCHTLKQFINRNRRIKIIFSCTLRNILTLEEFFKILDQFDLTFEEIYSVSTWDSSFTIKCEVKVFSFELKNERS